MIFALYVIGSTVGLLLLSARLREARADLARMWAEYDDREREEYTAYAHGVVSLACLLAGLAVAPWCAPPRPAARPAGSGRAGARTQAPAGGPDGRAAG